MKLIVQIPCLNEAATLPSVIAAIPRKIHGVQSIQVIVIDDGSSDATAAVALASGADAVVRIPTTCGLARAFTAGIRECLARGADIIVTMDGDGQHDGRDIPALAAPVLEGCCKFSLGQRPLALASDMSQAKQTLQRVGSRVISMLAGVAVYDAACGFRAMTREAALAMDLVGDFSHTMESLVICGAHGWTVANVPVTYRPSPRPSRLAGGMAEHLRKSLWTLLYACAVHRPWRFCALLGLAGTALGGTLAGLSMIRSS